MNGLVGRTALITGASRGIGAAIALAFAKEGVNVAINYNSNREAAHRVAEACRGAGVKAAVYQADVTDFEQCRAMAEAARAEIGVISILVNNAGIGSAAVGRKLVVETPPEDVLKLIAHHTMGSLYMCQLLVPAMRDLGRGDVIMISSQAAQQLGANGVTYNIAKAGMEALAHTLAKEERKHGIRVNIVAPGLVDTDMGLKLMNFTAGVTDLRQLDERMPFGFVCQPSDIANAVVFLCSEEGRYITNQRLTVNGGGF
ncbi:MAG TPA: SDR family oxidoreductase [Dehalococcoidia bacterium]|nr:SDR family oxidoreductase [Dehalococcoidia bacterium]